MNDITIGIDIAKYKFDAAIIGGKNPIIASFDNNLEGFAQLLKVLPKTDSYRFIMEATGNYNKELAIFLHSKGYKVSVLNPAQIKYYAKSKLIRAKTDKVDARVIAEFAIAHPDLPIFEPLEKAIEKFRNFSRCLINLKDDAAMIKTRIKSINDKDIQQIYSTQLDNINKQIKDLKALLMLLIESNVLLKKKAKLLESIPGIGTDSAITLLAEMPDLKNFKHAKQLSAFIGLNPTIRLSGKSVRGRSGIAKMGNNILRKALFLPAMVASRFNPVMKKFADRLKDKGKNGKVIIIAVMRKLAHLIFAILKKSISFDRNFSTT